MLRARNTIVTGRTLLATACLLMLFAGSTAANQYVVKSTADAGTHTLRWAILQANATPGADVITFEIPGIGPHAIIPASPLPPLTDQAGVIIDGLSQPGSAIGNKPPETLTLRILLDGVHAGPTAGIWLLSSNNLVQGLVITRFTEDGIRIQSAPEGSSRNVVRYCIVGLDPEGTDPRGNGLDSESGRWAGLSLISVQHAPGDLHDNTIENNIISGNHGDGIIIADCPGGNVYRNTVKANFIGTSLSGDVARANKRDGILIVGGSYENTLTENVISGNGGDGMHLVGDMTRSAFTYKNVITRNRVGISRRSRLIGNGRNGISIGGADYNLPGGFAARNRITSNIIAGNKRSGVVVWEHEATENNADENRVGQNSIFANGRFAIDLGNDGMTLNDPADTDTGPNDGMNSPLIVSAEFNRGVTTVRGTVSADADPTTVTVELYKYIEEVPPNCNGSLYLGRVSPDGGGNWVYSTTGSLLPGDRVVAQATDHHDNSSEYSREKTVKEGSDIITEELNPLITRGVGLKASAMIAETVIDDHTGVVQFSISVEHACWGILEIFTSRGELVRTLVNRWLPAGDYTIEWNGKNWKGDQVENGTYMCRFDADGVRQSTNIAL